MRLPVNHAAVPLLAGFAATSLIIAGVALAKPAPAPPLATSGPAADYPMVIGDPFTVDGVTYTPADTMNSDQVGYAAVGEAGGAGVTIAHRTLPLPSYAEVTNLDNGHTILVRVERRGPMTGARLIELSPGAAAQIDATGDKTPIRIRRVNPPEAERALLRAGQRAPARMDTPTSLVGVLRRKLDPALAPAVPAPLPSVAAAVPAKAVPAPASLVQPAPPVPTAKPAPKVAAAPASKPAVAPKPTALAKAPPPPVAAAHIAPAKTVPAPVAKASAKAPAAPVAKAPAKGGFAVQVGAFEIKANADKAARATGGSAHAAGKLASVRVGPFATRAEAEAALAKARAAGYSEARIQRVE